MLGVQFLENLYITAQGCSHGWGLKISYMQKEKDERISEQIHIENQLGWTRNNLYILLKCSAQCVLYLDKKLLPVDTKKFLCGWPNRNIQKKMQDFFFFCIKHVLFLYLKLPSNKLASHLSRIVEWLYSYDMMEFCERKKLWIIYRIKTSY